MTDYIGEFKAYLTGTKKVSANTLQSYMRDIELFLEYLEAKSIDPARATNDVVNRFVENLLAKGRSEATVTRMLATIRCFYHFLNANGESIIINPTVGVKLAKSHSKLPEILTNEEIDLLLAQPDVTELKGGRDKAMLELLYATGIRVSELIMLNVEDVNFELGIIYCRSGKKERVIPVYDEALEILSDYIKRIRNVLLLDLNETVLFTNMNGSAMTRQGFWKIIKAYAKQANIQKDITPHTLRHSFAAHLLENGAPLKDIKELMGHSDISSTQVYSKLIKQKYKNTYTNYHPKAKRA